MQAKDKVRMDGGDIYTVGPDGKTHSAIAEDAYVTSCAEACPNGAIVFGDLNNPEHKVHQLVFSGPADPKDPHKAPTRNPNAFRLLERLGTETAVYYLSSRDWVRRLGDNYLKDEVTQKPVSILPKKH
jgi:molybdopterin-containing oxidoreductase family iron-sulfur binding subunit